MAWQYNRRAARNKRRLPSYHAIPISSGFFP